MTVALEFDRAHVDIDGKTIVEDLSLAVAAGEVVGLLGPNGCGKTTALRALMGQTPLSSGSTRIMGVRSHDLSARERALKAAYLPQIRPLAWPIAVEDAVMLGRFAYGAGGMRPHPDDQAAVSEAIEAAGLSDMRRRAVSDLSGGELARVHIARAFAARTPALIADEPAAALDPYYQLLVMDLLSGMAEKGCGVLVVLHDITLAARYCTRIALMLSGRIVADGSPADVLTADRLRAVYRVNADVNGPEPIVTVRDRA